MDIYYPKDNAVSHGKVHELLDPEALKRGEPLTEESIRWLLELHGEMYLIEQHYSTRTRMRRLALNGTPVAEFSDVEPMVDFQLGTANIRMCFTVRGNGIVYELFVNGKRFEDLTQALPSPIAARAEGSGMTFGAPLMSQRLGLLPPHLQQPPPPQAPQPQPQQQMVAAAGHEHRRHQRSLSQQIVALPPLDSSLSSLTQPIPHDAALALLDESYHSLLNGAHPHPCSSHQRRASRRISISLGAGGGGSVGGQQQNPVHHHHQLSQDAQDIFASLAAASAVVASATTAGAGPGASHARALSLTSAAAAAAHQGIHIHQHHHHIVAASSATPETTAAAGTPTTLALSSGVPGSISQAGSAAWGMDMGSMLVDGHGGAPSFVVALASPVPLGHGGLVTNGHGGAGEENEAAAAEGRTAMVVVGGNGNGNGSVHGAGLLRRPSVEELYFSSDDEADMSEVVSAMVVAAPAGAGAGTGAVAGGGGAAGGRAAQRRRRGTTAEFLLQEGEGEGGAAAGVAMMDTTGAWAGAGGGQRIVLPAFKVAKTSEAARPATSTTGVVGAMMAAAPQGQQQGEAAPVEKRRRGLVGRVLAVEGDGPSSPSGAVPIIQRSLSASDVMNRPPNLKIIPPPPPTAFHRSVSLHQQRGAAGARGVQPPVCKPR